MSDGLAWSGRLEVRGSIRAVFRVNVEERNHSEGLNMGCQRTWGQLKNLARHRRGKWGEDNAFGFGYVGFDKLEQPVLF